MDPKPRPNHREYILALRRMGPQARVNKAMEMSDFVRDLFRQGLRKRFPDLPEEAFRKLYLERLELCHNRNW
jgi:hypothetical protein